MEYTVGGVLNCGVNGGSGSLPAEGEAPTNYEKAMTERKGGKLKVRESGRWRKALSERIRRWILSGDDFEWGLESMKKNELLGSVNALHPRECGHIYCAG